MCPQLDKKRKIRDRSRRFRFADDLIYKMIQNLPVNKGDVVRVKITETTVDKIGVARIGLYKIRIPGSRLGEEVKAKIIKVSEKGAIAERVS